MTRPTSSTRRWARGMLALAAVALCGFVDRVQVTEAAWVDREVAAATVSALTVPPPVIDSCSGSSAALGLNPTMTLVWHLPPGPYTVPTNIRYYGAPGGLLPGLLNPLLGFANTVPGPGAGQYTSTFGSGVLTGLLGGTYTVGLATALSVEPNSWQSVRVGRMATFLALGGPVACSIPT